MDARAVLDTLRSGGVLSPQDVSWFAQGLADGRVDDAQAGAFAMGICRSPLSDQARAALTLAMRDTGEVLSWDLPGPVVDKHSTGGVGDPMSLILGPVLAALGCYVPLLSGRGLGHTGGTLDKLESIPGVTTELSMKRFQSVTEQAGWALAAASVDVAPADRRLYAIRDVTSTVQSIDLITASILSKKLAGGVGPLVLDVKAGSGAFMADPAQALELATSLTRTANHAAGPCVALVTDMNQPCVRSIGNALEIAEVMRVLTGAGDDLPRLLVTVLGIELLQMVGVPDNAGQRIEDAINNGAAAAAFQAMISLVGGPRDFVSNWSSYLPKAPVIVPVPAPKDGYVAGIDGKSLGTSVVRLGGGRLHSGDAIDPAVGLSEVVRIGSVVAQGDALAQIHAASADAASQAASDIIRAFEISASLPSVPDLIKGRIA